MSSSIVGDSTFAATQRVVVIQDASKELSSTAVKWAIDGLSLKPGDELTLLGVLHQVNTPSTLFFLKAKNKLSKNPQTFLLGKDKQSSNSVGYKSRIASNSVLATNTTIIDKEVARREEEYQTSAEIMSICELYESKKIGFNISVVAASSPKVAALDAANKLKATWIILDRQMKKDKNYFMEQLSCGIYRMKRNNCVELLREPKVTRRNDEILEGNAYNITTYNEMLPTSEIIQGLTDDEDLFSLDLSSINFSNLENKHPSVQLKEEDYLSIQIAADDKNSLASKMLSTQNDEIMMQEYPVCKECGNERPKASSLRKFTYSELHNATNGFSEENFLSDGGFGSVFKGKLKNGQWIAMKQHKQASSQGEREFGSEVNLLGTLKHKNVVMLLGSCSEGNHRLLVYEYVCNGSLEQHLSKSSASPLSWEHRLKIALGAATGLNYLHKNDTIHRDMRPNNILLTHDCDAMLGDFGLSRKQWNESARLSENKVVGTFGYLAPEYTARGRVSTKTDVYSFGVVLLELITGRTTLDKSLEDKGLVGWARPLLRERKYPELIDERILDCHDLHQLFWMIILIERCLRKSPDRRPSMDKVERILKYMTEGEIVGGSEDFYSSQSSMSNLTSEDEQESQQKEITSEDITSTSKSQTSDIFSMSTSMAQSSDTSFSTKPKSFWNKIVNPPSHKILYDEMLNKVHRSPSHKILYDEMLG